MRILVTGATGFIGRYLAPALAVRKDTAVSLLLREAYSQPGVWPLPPELAALRPRLACFYADLRNRSLTCRAVAAARPDVVIHLAATGVTRPFLGVETALAHNLRGTINLIRACFEKGSPVTQLIMARTPGERSSMNVYAASKAAAWNFCQMYACTEQWPIHGAMIFQAYGPGQPAHNLIPAAMAAATAGQDFPMTAGTQKRDWIYVTDVVAGILATVGKTLAPGTTVELGSGQLTSVAEVVEQIYALIGGDGRPLVGALPGRPGEVAEQAANAQRTLAQIGWQTAVSLAEGLRRTMAGGQIL